MHSPSIYDAFAVAAPGLEAIVAAELRLLRASRVHSITGGVEFRAGREVLYTANLHLRSASRVLVRLASFHADSFAELERRARRLPWASIIPSKGRVHLRVTCHKSRLYHSDAVAERIYDAIGAATGASPTRKTRDAGSAPDDDGDEAQLFVVRLERDECAISVDTSGAALHRRGYRLAVTQAPLRETLAGAMLLASGWDGSTPLLDPFCGSGTIPIEAARFARRIAPGRDRRFRFMDWPDFDKALWAGVWARAREAERTSTSAPIVGTDRSGWALRAANGNAARADVEDDVVFGRHDANAIVPPAATPGWLVSNPPYGVRLGRRDELRALYAHFGASLRGNFAGWHIGILSTDRRLDAQLRVPLLERFRTSNGGIRVHFLVGHLPVSIPA